MFRPWQKPPAQLPVEEIERVLEAAGAILVSTKGKESKWRRLGKNGKWLMIIVPNEHGHAKQVPKGTLGSVIRQSGLSRDEFWGFYYGLPVEQDVGVTAPNPAED